MPVDDDHEPIGRRGHDLLPCVRSPSSFHEPQPRADLIRSVHREVEAIEPLERFDVKAELECCALGGERSGHASDAQSPPSQRWKEMGHRGPRSESHSHLVLGQKGRRFGRGKLRPFDVVRLVHGAATLPERIP